MKVYHIVPTLQHGDAVSNDARALNAILVELGWNSRIYVARTIAAFEQRIALSIDHMPATKPEDILIYHLSTGDNMNDRVAEMPGHLLVIYHNITPPKFFAPYDQWAATRTAQGYAQACRLAQKAEYCLADSNYNASELRRLGYTCPIDVLPILIPFEDYNKAPDAKVIEKYKDGRTNLVFVGRVAPNKRQEDVIRAFDCYKKNYDPTARLFLVGGFARGDAYYRALRAYCRKLGVRDVIFPGHIRFEEILAYYTVADLFLCMSDHEGFCVPLVEAMHFHLPIVAKDTTAIADTMGAGGVLLPDSDPLLAAAAIHRVLEDAGLKASLLAAQQQRLCDFGYETVAQQFCTKFQHFAAQVEDAHGQSK